MIYRVDPATGKASVFFDLNTVLEPARAERQRLELRRRDDGLVNWYDIAFDPEGYFNGKPSMFVSSVDRSDPNKNIVYQISPQGTFLGVFVNFTDGLNAMKFNVNPTSILIPPVQDQSFLRGLFTGTANAATLTPLTGTPATLVSSPSRRRAAARSRPGCSPRLLRLELVHHGPDDQQPSSLPVGVETTAMDLGPQVGMTAANPDYRVARLRRLHRLRHPARGGPAWQPGPQRRPGPGRRAADPGPTAGPPPAPAATTTTNLPLDQLATATTDFRRFQDIAFDQYGYFSQGFTLTASTTTTTGNTTTGTNTGSVGNTVTSNGTTFTIARRSTRAACS